MEKKEINYFTRMSLYEPKGIKDISENYMAHINYFVKEIRKTAKEALSREIFVGHAKERISDLVELINKLKTMENKNVTLG